jgi:hypothetical protein
VTDFGLILHVDHIDAGVLQKENNKVLEKDGRLAE